MLGTVRSEDLLSDDLDQQLGGLRELCQEALYLPRTSKAYHALKLFRQSCHHHALIVNEFGSVLGLLTLYDLFNALVGDLLPNESRREIVRRDDGSFFIDAQLPFDEFTNYFHLAADEREGLTGFRTLAGFVLQRLGAVPQVGQHFTWHGHHFEAVDLDHSRIDKVLYRPKASAEAPSSSTST